MKIPDEAYLLILNKYQRDNLVWLIQAIGMVAGRYQTEPFHLANTGDWLGEIYNMLEGCAAAVNGNMSHEELDKAVAAWTGEQMDEWLRNR